MGIDIRLADHLARGFRDMLVLESCTGGGFSAIALARHARHVFTVETEKPRMEDARRNALIAGVGDKITFINLDVSPGLRAAIPDIDAAFLDPDWAVTGEDHVYCFIDSNTGPPSDRPPEGMLLITPNVTIVQPPCIRLEEFYPPSGMRATVPEWFIRALLPALRVTGANNRRQRIQGIDEAVIPACSSLLMHNPPGAPHGSAFYKKIFILEIVSFLCKSKLNLLTIKEDLYGSGGIGRT